MYDFAVYMHNVNGVHIYNLVKSPHIELSIILCKSCQSSMIYALRKQIKVHRLKTVKIKLNAQKFFSKLIIFYGM